MQQFCKSFEPVKRNYSMNFMRSHQIYGNILDSGYHIFSKGESIFRGDICDMRRLWGLVGGLARPLRLALLLLLSGQPLTGLLIRMRKVVMMGVNVVLIPLLLFLSIKVVTINIFICLMDGKNFRSIFVLYKMLQYYSRTISYSNIQSKQEY